MAIAADIRILSCAFLRHGSLVLQVAALSARLDEISLCLQLPKANQLLAHLALLAGPEALSRPATAQNSLGRGRRGALAGLCPACEAQKKVPPSAGFSGQPQLKPHRTANSAKAVIS
jgi:hypothetical protein